MSDDELKLVSEEMRKVLLNDGTSKCNKVWIAVGLQDRGYWLEWDWPLETLKGFASPVKFRFEPDGKWIESKSFDEKYQAMKDPEKRK